MFTESAAYTTPLRRKLTSVRRSFHVKAFFATGGGEVVGEEHFVLRHLGGRFGSLLGET